MRSDILQHFPSTCLPAWEAIQNHSYGHASSFKDMT